MGRPAAFSRFSPEDVETRGFLFSLSLFPENFRLLLERNYIKLDSEQCSHKERSVAGRGKEKGNSLFCVTGSSHFADINNTKFCSSTMRFTLYRPHLDLTQAMEMSLNLLLYTNLHTERERKSEGKKNLQNCKIHPV